MLNIQDLRNILPDNLNQFYQYYGSQTIGQCKEIVSWYIFKVY